MSASRVAWAEKLHPRFVRWKYYSQHSFRVRGEYRSQWLLLNLNLVCLKMTVKMTTWATVNTTASKRLNMPLLAMALALQLQSLFTNRITFLFSHGRRWTLEVFKRCLSIHGLIAWILLLIHAFILVCKGVLLWLTGFPCASIARLCHSEVVSG